VETDLRRSTAKNSRNKGHRRAKSGINSKLKLTASGGISAAVLWWFHLNDNPAHAFHSKGASTAPIIRTKPPHYSGSHYLENKAVSFAKFPKICGSEP
jgi:hypothetical protein